MLPSRKMRSFGEKADNHREVLACLSSEFIVLIAAPKVGVERGYKQSQHIVLGRLLKMIPERGNHIEMWA